MWISHHLPRSLPSLPPLFTIIKIKGYSTKSELSFLPSIAHIGSSTNNISIGRPEPHQIDESLHFSFFFNISNNRALCAVELRRLLRKILSHFCNLKKFHSVHTVLLKQCISFGNNQIIHLILCKYNKLQQMEKYSGNCALIL